MGDLGREVERLAYKDADGSIKLWTNTGPDRKPIIATCTAGNANTMSQAQDHSKEFKQRQSYLEQH